MLALDLLQNQLLKKQFADQNRTRLILQLINGISRVPRKLTRYFNGTIISTSLVCVIIVCLGGYFYYKSKRNTIIINRKINTDSIV